MNSEQNSICAERGDESLLEWVDSIADRFEHDWNHGPRPDIRRYLGESSAGDRARLLVELIQIDFAYRDQAGDDISVSDYFEDFPELHALDEETRHALILYARRISSCHSSSTHPLHAGDSTIDSSEPKDEETAFTKRMPLPRILGKFELLELLGEGAFGSVYRAKDVELGRMVAVKIPRAGTFDNPGEKERFLREARSAARLRHPRIVPVLEIAHEKEMPYFVSAYIEGETLREYALRENLTFRQSAELVARIAEALDHAHHDGVIHRDIKPANILIDKNGEPHLTDFGLAKSAAGADVSMTIAGQVLGAPAYMSPEQARGDSASADTRSDVYGLGVILYELLTGERPFQGNVRMLLLQVLNDEPRTPRRLNDGIPRDLETICLKAMAKSPADRYESAGALTADLRRFLNGEPIAARPIGVLPRTWRWCRRNPLTAGLTLAIALAMTAGTVVSLYFALLSQDKAREANQNATDSARNAVKAEEQTRLAQRENIFRELQLRRLSGTLNGWRATARHMIITAAGIRIDDELRDNAVPMFRGLDATCARHFGVPKISGASSVAFDPRGERLLFGGHNDRARIWTISDDTVVPPDEVNALDGAIGTGGALTAGAGSVGRGPVAFRADGTPVELVMTEHRDAGATIRRAVVLRTVPGQKIVKRFPIPRSLPADADMTMIQFQWALSRDARTVAVSLRMPGGEKTVWVWKVDDDSPLPNHTLTAPGRGRAGAPPVAEKSDARLALTPDGALVAAASSSGEVTVWSVEEGSIVANLKSTDITIHSLRFHPMIGRNVPRQVQHITPQRWMLAAGDSGGKVYVWDIKRRTLISQCPGASVAVYALAFTPDGTLLAAAGRSAIRIWDVATGRLVLVLGNPPVPNEPKQAGIMLDYILDLDFSPDGKQLAAAAIPSTRANYVHLHVWNMEYDQGIRSLRGLSGRVAKTVFSPTGDRLAALSLDWQVGIWDCQTGRLLRMIDVPEGFYPDNTGLAFSNDGRQFAFATGTRAVVWDVDSGMRLREWPDLPPGFGDCLAFDSRQRLILVRFETENQRARPFTQTKDERRHNPFVCRTRILTSATPYQVIAHSKPFQDIRRVTLASDGSHFLVHGKSTADPENRQIVMVMETATCNEVWRAKSLGASLDSTECTVLVTTAPGPGNYELRELRTGRRIKQTLSACGPHGPLGGLVAAANHPIGSRRNGTAILPQKGGPPLFRVGIEDPHPVSPILFRRDGEALAWSDGLGNVYYCNVRRIVEGLKEVGLKPVDWPPSK